MSPRTAEKVVIVGGGILGLCLAEAFQAQGASEIQIWDAGLEGAGSRAAAAQLGVKGQSLFRSPDFAWKIAGQRQLEKWAERWWKADRLGSPFYSLFRRGWGVDVLASDAAYQRQRDRICQHERKKNQRFVGPSLIVERQEERELWFAHEASVDAPELLCALRACLGASGVHFVDDLFTLESLAGLSTDSLVFLCAGAWSPSLAKSLGYDLRALSLLSEEKSLSWGHTLDIPLAEFLDDPFARRLSPADAQPPVVLGFADPFSGEKYSLTLHRDVVRVTSISCPLPHSRTLGGGQSSNECDQALARAQAFLQSFGVQTRSSFSAYLGKSGYRLRACSKDLRMGCLRAPDRPDAFFFAGANRSGFLYGPVVAAEIVEKFRSGMLSGAAGPE